MTDSTDVLCAGYIVADHVSSPISHLPGPGELVLADQLLLTIGGCAANVAVDLVKLGLSAAVVGRVGEDVFGRIVADMLRQRQVDVSALQISSDLETSQTLIVNVAYRIAESSFIPGGINRVLLGTDGDFNVGVTNQGDLVRLIEDKRKSGVYLTILGFGMGNLKDSTMEKLSHHGNGHYAYIDSETEARKVFIEQGAALVTVAKDVKLQIEFNPQRVGAYRLIGYEDRLLQAHEFNDDKKDAGDMGSGHTVTALYEIIPPGQPLPGAKVDALKYQQTSKPSKVAGNGEFLTVKLRYKDPEAETSKLLSQPLSGEPLKLSQMPPDFRFASAVAAFGILLRNSEYRGTASYAGVRKLASSALGKDRNGHRAEFLDLVNVAESLASSAAVKRE